MFFVFNVVNNRDGYITSKKIKDIFDIFKEKATQDDIESNAKSIGCDIKN